MKTLKTISGFIALLHLAAHAGGENINSTTSNSPLVVNRQPKIAVGDFHTCVVKVNGTVVCWGANNYGQLGDGTTEDRLTPVQVPSLTGVSSIAAGESHTCALKTNGTVACWGSNRDGQLGDDTTTNRHTPVMVSDLTDVSSIAAGASAVGHGHTCALKTDGTVVCWGGNVVGQLGDGTGTDRHTPVHVSGLTSALSIAAGFNHTCALKTDGTVACWGANNAGQLGDGTTKYQNTPVIVSGLTGVSSIATGPHHTCALKTDGTVACWGWNLLGQLGDGTIVGNRLTPVAVSGLSGALSVAAGGAGTCAVKTDGTVACWGGPNFLGGPDDGSETNLRTLVTVSGLTGVSSIAVSFFHACALKTDGTVTCWSDTDTPPRIDIRR